MSGIAGIVRLVDPRDVVTGHDGRTAPGGRGDIDAEDLGIEPHHLLNGGPQQLEVLPLRDRAHAGVHGAPDGNAPLEMHGFHALA